MGPNIQLPTSLNDMFTIVEQEGVETISVKQEWAAFLASVAAATLAATRSGTTSSRPTSQSQRYIGQPYMDTTLGYPVFLRTATNYSSSDVWVDATGTPA